MLYKVFKYAIHAALCLIVVGAVVSWIGARSLTLTMGIGETAQELPFELTLRSFEVVNYPGTSTPADYVCRVDLDGKPAELSMNHIARSHGYRFFLKGYDEYGGGVTLTARYDPWGTGIVYSGYFLLLIGMIGMLFTRSSRFRAALSRLGCVAALLFAGALGASAAPAAPKALPREVADEFGHLYVFYNGRIAPMQTMARDYVMKAYGKPSYHGYSAEQVFTGWMLFYDSWKDIPLKKKGMEERRQAVLSVASGKAVKMFPILAEDGSVEWYSSADRLPFSVPDDEWTFVKKVGSLVGEYAFEKDYEAISGVITKVGKFQRDRVGEHLPSEASVRAERAYNALGRPFVPAIVFVMLGIALFLLAVFKIRPADPLGRVFGALGLAYMTVVLALRWYVSGHVPLASGFELMLAIAWAACLAVSLAGRRFSALRPMGILLAGFAMMVASLGESNPKIGPLQPVLSSPLLSVHVSCMMLAYTLFGLLALCGLMGLISKQHKPFADRGMAVMYPALLLMVAGTVMGSLWANVSWGTYWNWDPKETWSLITIIVYALPLHGRYFAWLREPRRFNWFCLLAFSSVLMTYFGVNLLFGGMHSYAG